MQIIVNGQRRECAAASLADVWRQEIQDATQDDDAHRGVPSEPRGYAIALNGAVVQRDAWRKTPVGDGDEIEIVRAMQGG